MLKDFCRVLFCLVTMIITINEIKAENKKVVSHNRELVVTGNGAKSFANWVEFKDINPKKVRRVIMNFTIACPKKEGFRCADWDYADPIYIRKIGSQTAKNVDIEIARMLTPYGGHFSKDWEYSFTADITEFLPLLKDSVLIDYVHTGWEPSHDRGWDVTVEFEFVEGEPLFDYLGIEKLYNGYFLYGNKDLSIEDSLKAKGFKLKEGVDLTEILILQTGHGMDKPDNCAEFCDKYRDIYFNNEFVNRKQLWRECADNSLYPQAGTWIFDRANWCPGYFLQGDRYYLKTDDPLKREVAVDINMEPYISTAEEAHQFIASYFVQSKDLRKNRDLELVEILSPSGDVRNARENTVLYPKIKVRNLAKDTAKSVDIRYFTKGFKPVEVHHQIKLAPFKDTIIELLPNGKGIDFNVGENVFCAELIKVNSQKDEYKKDNIKESHFLTPEILPQIFDIVFIPNNQSDTQNAIYLLNGMSKAILDYPLGSLKQKDTLIKRVTLGEGVYNLILDDEGDDGLEFWFNAKGGSGKFFLKDTLGRLIKYFNPDFGSYISFSFYVKDNLNYTLEKQAYASVYPTWTSDKFSIELYTNSKSKVKVVFKDRESKILSEKEFGIEDFPLEMSVKELPEERYFVEIEQDAQTFRKRVQKSNEPR